MTSSIAELNELLTTLANMKAERDGLLQEAQDLEDVAAKARDDAHAAKREAGHLEKMIKVLSNAESAMNGIIKHSEELKAAFEADLMIQASAKDDTFRKFAREIIDTSEDVHTISFAKDEITRLGLDEETDQEAQQEDASEEQAELDLDSQAA